ncbi:hypothetical protein BST92_06465 [Nonlabens arenilitoris]|uniref:Uncharacterized protein n=1 Tax=Nonlabens arenilitoris TaxID=1217969 RepID=A0A2S7UBG6_9FLAO|nr:DUF2480 family protein [Nonlabens arenilitoris]PQJ31592.1 hypothetical protein BST92_06465 [Nonlabens arenilitoris]
MEGEIINRVANSKLQVIDLEDYYPVGTRSEIDISQWLMEGIVLVESRFRESLKSTDFTAFKDHYVAVNCSTDAIIPQWAWMLIQIELTRIAKIVILGSLEDLEAALYMPIIDQIDLGPFRDMPVIVKGCSNKPVPVAAYMKITERLQDVAKSVMYGEACSAVPVYKKKK